MNAIDVLKTDHDKVQQLFTEYISADGEDFGRREDLFQQIEMALIAHTDAEEQIFYPAMQTQAPNLIKRSVSEHQQMKQLLADMLLLEVDDDEFETRMNMLIRSVQYHVEEEEGTGGVFELARRTLSDQDLDDMARRIQQSKRQSERDLAA